MSFQVGAHHWEKEACGAGVFLFGVPGFLATSVSVLGGGVAGDAATRSDMGFEAEITALKRSLPRHDKLDWRYGAQFNTVDLAVDAVERLVRDVDLFIGLILVAGAAAPKVLTEEMIKSMPPVPL